MCKCSRTSSEMLFNLTVVFFLFFAFYAALEHLPSIDGYASSLSQWESIKPSKKCVKTKIMSIQ